MIEDDGMGRPRGYGKVIGIEALLASYPRSRPKLSREVASVYVSDYLRNRAAKSGLPRVVGGLESWMHRTIAADGKRGERILEIGAGTLNHVRYEHGARVYDAVEPFSRLWKQSPELRRITKMYGSVDKIPSGKRYDRIISIAVLEHLVDLPWVVAKSGTLLAEGGRMEAGIPAEGGLLWGLGWRATTGVAFRLRYGLDYAEMMRHEHINTAREILNVVSHFFGKVSIRRFPLPAFHASLYGVVTASQPRVKLCEKFCASRPLGTEKHAGVGD